MPTTLKSLVRSHMLRLRSKTLTAPGSDPVANARQQAAERLTIEVAATLYPVFILGAHDPDDAETDRYIP